MIIAIVGMPGSGKSLAADYMKSMGLPVVRFGQVVIDELMLRGMDLNPENERIVREEIRNKEGADVCARRSLSAIHAALSIAPAMVVDGLYSWSELKTLRKEFGKQLIVVHVFAPRSMRYRRLKNRTVRPLTQEEAEERDVLEIERIEKGGPIAIADYLVLNEGTEAELAKATKALLRSLLAKRDRSQK